MLRFFTAGESHGPGLTGVIEGLPANLNIDLDNINHELYRRQQGYGRGRRMQIEKDVLEILSGIRFHKTLGSPVSFLLRNKDWMNWDKIMAIGDGESKKVVTRPRPGHADLSGSLKYGFDDIRNVLERSSARETAMRVAIGAFAKQFLNVFGIEIHSHVIQIGHVPADPDVYLKLRDKNDINALADQSPVRCLDNTAEKAMIAFIDKMKDDGDTSGGIIQMIIRNVPPGLGSYVQWDRKLDSRLAAALVSVQAVKGVEFGVGFEAGKRKGSDVHDEIFYKKNKFYHKTNNAGGIEGGMSTGEEIVIQIVKKPIPTLMKPLYSVDMNSKEPIQAHIERSDVTAVPACAVICEAVAAPVIADLIMEKFGSDSVVDIKQSFESYLKRIQSR